MAVSKLQVILLMIEFDVEIWERLSVDTTFSLNIKTQGAPLQSRKNQMKCLFCVCERDKTKHIAPPLPQRGEEDQGSKAHPGHDAHTGSRHWRTKK